MSTEALRHRLTTLLETLGEANLAERSGAVPAARLQRLRQWQSRRLGQSFHALRQHPHYAAAAEFFLADLYGSEDVSWRDRDVRRVLPTMLRWLPSSALDTLADALDLDLLSRRFDLAMAAALPDGRISVAVYARAYLEVGDAEGRRRQIELIRTIGRDLERIVRKPFILGVLKLARGPARGAGFGELQAFLERGFSAFRAMGPAEDFLARIVDGETAAMQRLFAAHPDPFGFALEG
ncbi:MAG: hypothetical protein AB7V26_04080 [Lysobacterales bacterium]